MNKINIGLIGCGRISDLHYLGYVNNPDAKLHSICDPNEKILEKKKSSWNVKNCYTDYRQILKDKKLDGVEIIAPTHLHEEIALAAIDAGKHVALQKPMTTTMESAKKITIAAKKSDKIFKVTDNYIHYPPIVFAKKLIDDGKIGTPHNLRIKMFAANDACGWEVPSATWDWREKEKQEGRPRQTFDHGHHIWAAAWYLMGDIEKVFGWIDYVNEGLIDSPAAIIWKYKDKYKMGMCEYCYSDELNFKTKYYACDEWFEITGSKGLIKINRCNGNMVDGPCVSLFSSNGWTHYSDIACDWSNGFIDATKNFVNAIKGIEEPTLTIDEGLEILKINFAIQKSAQTKKEIFINDVK